MNKNKLIIAVAGSGKTTFLISAAKKAKEGNVLIMTYTEANEAEIRNKFKGRIPKNVKIQTWFSFLLQHGVKPYQSVMNKDLHDKKIGFYLSEKQSGLRYYMRNSGIPVYWGKKDFFKYYFTESLQIYSDKVSEFIIECNEKANGAIINRISQIYSHIFIDEIQDLAGWDLEILKLLFNSKTSVLLVGDPRQVTYLTHHPKKYPQYKDGKIKEFIENECNKKTILCEIDETTLERSHRNSKNICEISSALYPNFAKSKPCDCNECRNYTEAHEGVFLIKNSDVDEYLELYKPIQLRWSSSIKVNSDIEAYNFGKSKGLSFHRVVIYPTKDMKEWLFDNSYQLKTETRSKLYVALTRAKYSVGIVCDYPDEIANINGIEKWK